MIAVLRRVSFQSSMALALLFLAFSALVAGLGSIVRGAQTSAFLPAALPAVLLGWCLARSRLKPWLALCVLLLLGVGFLWGLAARLFVPLLLLAGLTGSYLLQVFLYLHGRPASFAAGAAGSLEASIRALAAQSTALWVRLYAWSAALLTGREVSDPVARVLVWSLLVWLLAAWAGWEVSRNRPLAGLIPGLAVLAAVTKYTNADATWLWLMAVSLLALIGLSNFTANLQRWVATRVDYAELIGVNTTFAALVLTALLAGLGYVLPAISVKDILESVRRHDSPGDQAAQSLGLEAARVPLTATPSGFASLRMPALPNDHLLGSGPELSAEVVFSVQTGEMPPIPVMNIQGLAPRHYWRSYSFDVYTGSGWISSQVQEIKSPAGQPLFEIPAGYRLLKQEFELRHGGQGALYWSGTLYRSNLPFEAAWRVPPGGSSPQAVDPFRGADLFGALNSSPTYQVESLLPQASEAQLRAAGRDIPEFIQQRYTRLPSSVPERVYALARNLTSTSASPYDEALAIEGYLRSNYPYTLAVSLPPAGADVADYFLFDLKKGYCDYYATAMVVMARSVGLPARFVMGYASGTYDPPSAKYVVTAADAHAWVEIYFPGIGWVEFEPTAGRPGIIRSPASTAASRDQSAPLQQWGKFIRLVYTLPPVTRWGGTVLLGLLAFLGIIFLLEGWLLGLVRPIFALRWMVRSVYRQAGRLVGPPPPGQTALEFSAGLQTLFKEADPRLDELMGYYLRALFSPHPLARPELRRAIRAWRGLRWKLFWAQKAKKPSSQ